MSVKKEELQVETPTEDSSNASLSGKVFVITGKLEHLFEISHGGSSASIIDSKAVATRLLLCGATGFLLCHNHPSGDLTPSQSDREVTQKLVKLAKVMDLNFVDHIIIGMDDNGYTNFYSFRESGLI